jgi:hypothetical protein
MERFYRNFIGIVRVQSFVPKDSIGKFPIGFKSNKNPLFSLYSKGGLNLPIYCILMMWNFSYRRERGDENTRLRFLLRRRVFVCNEDASRSRAVKKLAYAPDKGKDTPCGAPASTLSKLVAPAASAPRPPHPGPSNSFMGPWANK